ncbi:MAG TPA: hypothetical protein VGN34_10950, partial [Ktedonobacteraceae bacterium]
QLRETVYTKVLTPIMADTVNAHELHADGVYRRIRPQKEEDLFDSQNWFITHPLFEEEEENNELIHADHTISAIPYNV